MGVRRYQDLIAWQTADAFNAEVIRLLHSSATTVDAASRTQLLAASQSIGANIAEGFLRDSPADFRRFLRIALGSLAEAEVRVRNGIRLGYFGEVDCAQLFQLGRRCATASARLSRSQLAFLPPTHRHKTRPR